MELNENVVSENIKRKEILPAVFLFLFVLIPFLPRFGALDAMGFHWMCYALLNVGLTLDVLCFIECWINIFSDQ
ncbi:MAG: hypothetical protein RLZZ94_919 [Bacteroidota bacterium]